MATANKGTDLTKAQVLISRLSARGHSQEKIAAAIGVSQATVSRLAKGAAGGGILDPRASTMERLEAYATVFAHKDAA